MRRFGEQVKPGQRYRVRPGVYAILERDGRYLLTFQSAPVPEFQLPGGGIDPGESPVAALHREVYEETGWSIATPQKVGVYRRFTFMPEYDLWAEKVCTIYRSRPVLQKSAPIEPGHRAVWTSREEALMVLTNQGDRSFFDTFG